MKFKVKAKTTTTISVEFEDGSHALIPILKGQTKEDIIRDTNQYTNQAGFASVSDVPIDVSDTWLEYVEEDAVVDYRTARSYHYPSVGKQFDSLYWAREGDDTEQKGVDAAIKLVKEKIPKGTSYKTSELKGLMD